MNPIQTIKAESPRFRDFVCSFGCAYETEGIRTNNPCSGEIEPQHWPEVSDGGDDTSLIALCNKHHAQFHGATYPQSRAVQTFVMSAGKLRHDYLASWLNLIEEANGLAPKAQRKQRASTRKNREPFKSGANSFVDGVFREAE